MTALFAKQLRVFLESSPLERQEIADRIGVHKQMLWLLQSGKRLPTPEMVDRVGQALELSAFAITTLHRFAARDRGYRI